MKSGNLNFLEPSGPLQACNGTDLPLPLLLKATFKLVILYQNWVTQWGSRLRHYATSWKVVSSIIDGVIVIFDWHNPSNRNVILGLSETVTEISTRCISWGWRIGKRGRCVGLTTLPPSWADCHEIWDPQLPETLRACPGLYKDCFTWFYTKMRTNKTRPNLSRQNHYCSNVTVWHLVSLFKADEFTCAAMLNKKPRND